MFRQAEIPDHEHLPEGGRHFVARRCRLAARPGRLSEVQSVSMEVSPADVYRCRDNLVTREIVGETIIVPASVDERLLKR